MFQLTVLSNLTFEKRIEQGQYVWINEDVCEEKCPVTEDQFGDWEWKLFHYDQSISSEDIIPLMEEAGFQPAQIGHLLALGAQYPEEQENETIIALGTIFLVGPYRVVPILSEDIQGRELVATLFIKRWSSPSSYLGVRRIIN